VLIPIVVLVAAFAGEQFRLFHGFTNGAFIVLWLFACGAGCVTAIVAIVGLVDAKSRRRWLILSISVLALFLNIAVTLLALLVYAISRIPFKSG
jgi:hypothetical protein